MSWRLVVSHVVEPEQQIRALSFVQFLQAPPAPTQLSSYLQSHMKVVWILR